MKTLEQYLYEVTSSFHNKTINDLILDNSYNSLDGMSYDTFCNLITIDLIEFKKGVFTVTINGRDFYLKFDILPELVIYKDIVYVSSKYNGKFGLCFEVA